MPAISTGQDLTYFYTDSAAPRIPEYDTVIIIHGHTFHGGVFKRLLTHSCKRGLRLLAINRRGYPGSTPYSEDELSIIHSSREDLLQSFMEQQGADLALLIDKLAIACKLPPGRNIILCAWSLGNAFLINLLASIDRLEPDVKERLGKRVKGILMWDPPAMCFGFGEPPGGWHPLIDKTLSPEARVPTFGVWAASYWVHGDLSTRDFSQLAQRTPLKEPPPTTTGMLPEELMAITCSFGNKGPDDLLVASPPLWAIQQRQSRKALLDPVVRSAWGNPRICHLMGDANAWTVIYGHWSLEDLMKASEKSVDDVCYKVMKGGNHFVMWDYPEVALDVLQECILGNMRPVSVGPTV